ncbi:hypothetical protein Cs7R123_46440 [Catellatospora sp. TT07R-123]|uniref:helix-turn-helix transcriptional regulator n=1 Tax=Catellatospora sp. TT07R-123 TaxID=2733863 RepID=UPI001B08FD5B|nr:helix-turn-helix transcriptional regulator [Catellatospora sp. TT07R-123]GHJ47302.1 hypothetical protein Cs7R123_46440 [Catellatospora sp. TT07R-123]
MLERLGVPAVAESVYWAMLEHPHWDVADIAHHIRAPESAVHDALSALADHALVQPSHSQPGSLRAVNPRIGLLALLDRAQQEMNAQQLEIQVTRAMILARAASQEPELGREEIVRLEGTDVIRDRLTEFARTAAESCLILTAGRAIPPGAIALGHAIAPLAMSRGVTVRGVYQESILNDPETLAFATWMSAQGEHSRIVSDVPLRMIIVDDRYALIPAEPRQSGRGALEVRSHGLVSALRLLFELTWDKGRVLADRTRVDENGLTDQALAILNLLRRGRTDEAIGRQLGLSERTVRRTVAEIMKRLDAESRFQAGVEAAARGWV